MAICPELKISAHAQYPYNGASVNDLDSHATDCLFHQAMAAYPVVDATSVKR